jgi:LysM repeat protein
LHIGIIINKQKRNIDKDMKIRILVAVLALSVILGDVYAQNIKTYKARRNDTMEKIAEKYNLSVETLRHYNSVYKDTPLKKGDIIIIPDSDVIPSEKPADTPYNTQTVVKELDFTDAQFIEHTVLPKETKYGISRRYSITQDDLTRLNPMLQTLGLQVGMVLKIPVLTSEQKEQSTQNIAAIEKMQGEQTTYTFHVVRP